MCDDLLREVEGAKGCALIDLGTGLPLAASTAPDAPGAAGEMDVMEVLAAVGTDFFRGRVNRTLRSAMGDPELPEAFVREIQTTTEDSHHFMCVVPGKEQTVLMLITDRNANLGLGWVAMRTALERVGLTAARTQRERAPGDNAAMRRPIRARSPSRLSPVQN